jgi:hypothetical protein
MKPIVAGSVSNGADVTKVPDGSMFEKMLRLIIKKHLPRSIIETGTYLGTGTTRIIASQIKDLGIKCEFHSIECNPKYHREAESNLNNLGLSQFVNLNLGVSVPKEILPTKTQIKSDTIDGDVVGMFVDHDEGSRVESYFWETNAVGLEHDILGKIIKKFKYRPDMLLLDSAGHMGNVEFNYCLSMIKSECIIALDDTNHVKHAKTMKQVKSDSRFYQISETADKFGSAICMFKP